MQRPLVVGASEEAAERGGRTAGCGVASGPPWGELWEGGGFGRLVGTGGLQKGEVWVWGGDLAVGTWGDFCR